MTAQSTEAETIWGFWKLVLISFEGTFTGSIRAPFFFLRVPRSGCREPDS